MRLLARQPGCLSAVLAAIAATCFAGCGYDFDAAFSDQAVATEASAPDATEASTDSGREDASSDVPSSDITAADVVIDSESGSEAATADVQPEASHCGDNKQNGDETGIDCGGSCDSCPQEVCTNQVDDDKDGKTDCADDDCGKFTCVAAAGVTGWTGPVMVRSGNSCDDGQPPLYSGGWGGLVNEPSCTGNTCSCAAPSGQVCGPPSLVAYDDLKCGIPIDAVKLLPGNCVELMGSAAGFTLSPAIPANGSCAPSGNPGAPGPVNWSVPAVVCPVGSGCASGGACTSPPASWGNDDFLCLVREGMHTCPSGWSVQGQLVGLATELPANVACAPCSCGAPSGGVCMGQTVETYGMMGCFGAPGSIQADGQCQSIDFSAVAWYPAGYSVGSTCAPAAPKVQGPLKATGFVTVCCLQNLP